MSELNKWDYDPARLAKTIHDISRKNIVDIGKIERMLENAIRKDA
jgi:hypothetical protein